MICIKRYQLISLITLVLLVSSCYKSPIRKDLVGKPLTIDDFSFLVDDKCYPAFVSQNTVEAAFPDGVWENRDIFLSSENPDMPGRVDLPTEEYSTQDVRFVFFDVIHYEIRNGRNGFTSIRNRAKTLRGVSVNDSIDDVFNAYGKTDWIEKNKDAWYSGWLMFTYKYYYETELNGEIQQLYDCIEFEIHDGIVVGIYYHFMNSDEI